MRALDEPVSRRVDMVTARGVGLFSSALVAPWGAGIFMAQFLGQYAGRYAQSRETSPLRDFVPQRETRVSRCSFRRFDLARPIEHRAVDPDPLRDDREIARHRGDRAAQRSLE